MKKSLMFAVVFAVASLLLAAGCAEVEEAVEPDEEQETAEVNDETVVTDQMGREVVIKGVPERIISLSPSNTEISFALGLGDRIVGVTEYCNYPPEAEEKVAVGGFDSPSIEKIIELEPDLVLASTIHNEEVPRLEELDITVLVIEASTLSELYDSMSLVAKMTGVPDAGEELIDSMRERIDAVEKKVSSVDPEDKVRVFYEVYSDPLMSAGEGAFINEIISLAGGENIFGDVAENYPQISAETVAERQPEIILYPDYHGTADFVSDEMAGRPGWESVPAVENKRIYAVSDDVFARPGPRVVEAVEEAAELLYPDKF